MNDIDMQEEVRGIYEAATDIAIAGEQLSLCFHVFSVPLDGSGGGPGVSIFLIPGPPRGRVLKTALATQIGRKMVDDGQLPVLSIVVFEAWVSTYKDGLPDDPPPPSEDPDRESAILTIGVRDDGELYSLTSRITYNPDGGVRDILPPDIMESGADDDDEMAHIPFGVIVGAYHRMMKLDPTWQPNDGFANRFLSLYP